MYTRVPESTWLYFRLSSLPVQSGDTRPPARNRTGPPWQVAAGFIMGILYLLRLLLHLYLSPTSYSVRLPPMACIVPNCFLSGSLLFFSYHLLSMLALRRLLDPLIVELSPLVSVVRLIPLLCYQWKHNPFVSSVSTLAPPAAHACSAPMPPGHHIPAGFSYYFRAIFFY